MSDEQDRRRRRSEWEAALHDVRRTFERSYDIAVADSKRKNIDAEARRQLERWEDADAEMLELIDSKLRNLKGD